MRRSHHAGSDRHSVGGGIRNRSRSARRRRPGVRRGPATTPPPGLRGMNPRPYALLAELTYRCPLHCPYCSNPVDYTSDMSELTTEEWCRVFGEAEELGVVQLHLTGGEPLARKDLETLTKRAREL